MGGGISSGRLHVVLVPGFAGFDALGQLEYYAGVTPLFRRWTEHRGQRQAALHYFDNFPTAAVSTRAARLRNYLAKRILRGEIAPGDSVVLVGHSTGGLDIRRLILDLTDSPEADIRIDGSKGVKAKDVLDHIRGVVFLSVPQRGTNLADRVRAHGLGRTLVVAELRAAAAGSQVPVVDRIVGWVASLATYLSGADLLKAVEDALREADVRNCSSSLAAIAGAQEAASQLELYLRHMATDFSAIDDLTSVAPDDGFDSPAHATAEMRREEMTRWERYGIATKSFATLGRRPSMRKAVGGTDVVYRICHRACAHGPLESHGFEFDTAIRLLNPKQRTQAGIDDGRLQTWDNDGIVNTVSMFWPEGNNTEIVVGDHMDIVGHYCLIEAPSGSTRRYRAYDLLGSASGFSARRFERIWFAIFDFCAQSAHQQAELVPFLAADAD